MAARGGASIHWGGLDKAVENAAKKLADKRELLTLCGEVLIDGTLQRFRDEEDPEGKKWAPTRRGGKILSDTAGLQRSIDSAVTSDSVYVGTNKPYGPTHQHGATIKPKNGKYLKFKVPGGGWVSVKEVTIKKRSFLGVSAKDRKELAETIKDYIAAAFKR
ncbi:MAG: hypothetical protein DELT_02524 [Desulfovibrio sp.]